MQRVNRGMETLPTDSDVLQSRHRGFNDGDFECICVGTSLFNNVINKLWLYDLDCG